MSFFVACRLAGSPDFILLLCSACRIDKRSVDGSELVILEYLIFHFNFF